MLDEKIMRLLEMAERGELPSNLSYPDIPFTPHFIRNGELAETGRRELDAQRYRTAQNQPPPQNIFREPLIALSQFKKLEARVQKLEEETKNLRTMLLVDFARRCAKLEAKVFYGMGLPPNSDLHS